MFEAIFAALFFFAPAGIANTMPVFAAKTPGLKQYDYPLDAYKTFRGKRIFGNHKTIRGFLAGFFGAWLTLVWLRSLYIESAWIQDQIAYVDYTAINIIWWAFVFNLGVLGGDALKSFFKRQFNRPPGSSWFPFDQLDYVIGGILTSLALVVLSPLDYLIIALVWFLLHPVATTLGWVLKLKKDPI